MEYGACICVSLLGEWCLLWRGPSYIYVKKSIALNGRHSQICVVLDTAFQVHDVCFLGDDRKTKVVTSYGPAIPALLHLKFSIQ